MNKMIKELKPEPWGMFMPQKVGYTEKVGMNLADGLLFPYDLNAASPSETCLLR